MNYEGLIYDEFSKLVCIYGKITKLSFFVLSQRCATDTNTRHKNNTAMASRAGDKRKRDDEKEQIGPSQKIQTKSSIKAAPVTYLFSTHEVCAPG